MPPALRKLLFFFFLGLPGLILQVAGTVITILLPIVLFASDEYYWGAILAILALVLAFAIGATMQVLSEALDHEGIPFLAKSPADMVREVAMKSLILLTWASFTATVLLSISGRYAGACCTGLVMLGSLAGCLALLGVRPKGFRSRLEDPPAKHRHKPVR